MYEALYEANKGLLKVMARQYARACALDRAVSEEDLLQSGFLALVRAQRTFDPRGGLSWVNWAAWNIRSEFNNLLGLRGGRFTRPHTLADSLDRQVGHGAERGSLGSKLVDENQPEPDEGLLLDEAQKNVHEAVERLADADERRAITLCKLEGRSCREVAGMMGVSAARARRLCANAGLNLVRDEKLREQLALDERTRFHAHKGVEAFNRDWTSVTEGAALWRIEQRGDGDQT